MSATVTFAGILAENPQLLYTHDGKPFVSCRVLVNRLVHVQNDTGEWVNQRTPHHVRVYGSAATNVSESIGTGDPVIVHGLERIESWLDTETGEERVKYVVVIDDRFGEVGISLK